MKNYKWSILIVLLTVFGCTAGDFLDSSLLYRTDENPSIERLNALDVVKKFSQEQIGTKSAAKIADDIKIKEIKVQTYKVDLSDASIPQTKAAITAVPDSLSLYTIIFEKNGSQGFSIATGDEELTQVYAYTENGNLADTVYNKGLAFSIAMIPYFAQYDLIQQYSQVQTRMTDPVDEVIELNIGPLVKTQWGQRYPYNLQCPITAPCNVQAPAGCTAIAIAQAVACLDIPRSRYQGTFNYAAFNNSASVPYSYQNMVAKLIAFIGKQVQMKYGCESSGARIENFRSTLDTWCVRYTCDIDKNVNISELVLSLKKGYPHITCGFQKTGNKEGHAWLWDGVKGKFHHTASGRGPQNYVPIGTALYHCNWGWNGQDDGWFPPATMEFPKSENAPFLDNNVQLYINSFITSTRAVNGATIYDDNLPPF